VNKKEKLAFAVVVALALTTGGLAFGSSTNNVNSNQVIYACVTGVNGNITKVSNTQKTCPKGTTPISWNMVGPQGAQGIPGIDGSAGAQGPKGIKGDQGDRGSSSGLSITSPDGANILKVMSYGDKNLVNIDNLFWSVDPSGSLSPVTEITRSTLQMFTSKDCSGFAYVSRLGNEVDPLVSNFVFSTGSTSSLLDEQAYAAEPSNVSLNSINSHRVVSSRGEVSNCELASNLDYILEEAKSINQYAKSRTYRTNYCSCCDGCVTYSPSFSTTFIQGEFSVTLWPSRSGFATETQIYKNPDVSPESQYGWGNFLQFNSSTQDFKTLTQLAWSEEEYLAGLQKRWNQLYKITPISKPASLSDWTWTVVQ